MLSLFRSPPPPLKGTAMNLSTATPLEIDTKLADLMRQAENAKRDAKLAIDRAHGAVGDSKVRLGYGRRPVWAMADEDAVSLARTQDTVGALAAVDALDEALTALADIEGEARTLEEEYSRRPWSRFFSVPGGHIHANLSFNCNRRPTTEQRWNPTLSGKTEAEAVAELGPHMCTTCFPSAPVEWTMGTPRNHCEGGSPVKGTRKRIGNNVYGECPTCGSREIVTMMGVVRKHKPAQAS